MFFTTSRYAAYARGFSLAILASADFINVNSAIVGSEGDADWLGGAGVGGVVGWRCGGLEMVVGDGVGDGKAQGVAKIYARYLGT